MPEEQQEVAEQIAAPSQEVTTTTESAAEEQQEPQDGEQPKPKGGFQKRIDRLTREKSRAEQEREYWRNEALRTSRATETPKATVQAEGKPSENDFQTHAEYLEALTDWKVDQKLNAAKVTERTESVKNQQQKALQDFAARENEFKAKTPDFDEVMADAADITASDGVIAEIVNSENGPELKYYLAKNPDEVERLNKLAPLALARAVGRIESRFTTSQEKTPANVTKAPPPPNPGSKSTSTSTKDPGEMSPAEYRVWFAKQAG